MENNFIHPTAIVEPGVIIGHNNFIGPGCFIKSGVVIGNNNRFEAFVMVGQIAEHRDQMRSKTPPVSGRVVIGHDNIFREFVGVHSGTKSHTIVGDHCTLLTKSHVSHDVVLHDGVTLSCGVMIGGHSILFDGCNFGLNACCHQFSRIGHFAMVGMGAVVTKKSTVEPFDLCVGVPAERIGENKIAIDRMCISDNDMRAYIQQFHKPQEA